MAHAPCPPVNTITPAHNARAHTRRKKPNRVFMQNPYRPIIIKFATKVTTFFRPMMGIFRRVGRHNSGLGVRPLSPQGGEGDFYSPRTAPRPT